MLAKCITPACDSQFKYFGRGVLMVRRLRNGHPSKDGELFWMCEDCARKSADPPDFVVLSRSASREKVSAKAMAA